MANQHNLLDVRLLILLFISVFYFDQSQSAILRFNTNNLDKNAVQKISLGNWVDKSLERRRRSSASDTGDHGKLDCKAKQLNGTEHHTEAYMHWSGKKSDDIFVLTKQRGNNGYTINSKLWQSRNYGDDYNEVVLSPSALLSYFYVSPVNPNQLIFVDSANKTLYVTKDALRNHDKSVLTFSPDRLLLHPLEADWLLGYSFDERKVYVSMDFGITWTLLQSEATYRVFWADPEYDGNNKTVHMEVQNTIGLAHYKACLIPNCEDITHTIDSELEGFDGMTMLVEKQYIFIQQTTNEESLLLVSYRRGPFKRTYFPLDIQTKDFMLVNADEGQVFMAVSHRIGVNLYLSDTTGQFYVATLENVVFMPRGGWFQIDLQEVKGMPATYLTNQQQPEHKTSRFLVYKTYISYDKGGNWSLIPVPPELKAECKSLSAVDCHLHLHLDFSSMMIPGILSEKKAPGLLMAHGNIGSILALNNINVFISSDGGWTWARAPMTGLFKFNILDQGSVMTAIMHAQVSSTKIVYYSLDDGLTWQNSTFIQDSEIRVDGVLNEPGITTLIESVYGHQSSDSGWIVVKINFKSILTRRCNNVTDYISWKPSDQFDVAGSTCILGEKIVYERKKPQSKCFNGKDYERPINKTTCPCYKEDFECDFGYKHTGDDFEECKKESWFSPDMLLTECPEGQKYNISHGFRKVAVDKCHGGVETKFPYKMNEGSCPLLPPAQLSLSSNQVVAATNSVVTFKMKQKMGSKINTTYNWNFGDLVTNISYFNYSHNMTHTYKSYGHYNVTVIAMNKEGSTSASVMVRVEDKITAIYVSIPWAVMAGVPMYCEVDVQGAYLSKHAGHVYFVWQFDETDRITQPSLTWNRNISHTYKPINGSSKSYVVSVEAVNSVSTVYKTFVVLVFKQAIFVELTFSQNVDYFDFETDIARRITFLQFLKGEISNALGVGQNRFAVVIHTIKPLTAQVMIVPSTSVSEKKPVRDIKTLAAELLDLVKHKALSLALDGIKDTTHFVQVTSAYIVTTNTDHTTKPSSKGANMRPVYIAIPILIAAAIVTGLVLLYYRRKFHESRRYSLLRHQVDSDHLLDNDDDDDPPLDLNPDFGSSDHRDIDDDHLDLGTGSLVVTTSNSQDDNTVNC